MKRFESTLLCFAFVFLFWVVFIGLWNRYFKVDCTTWKTQQKTKCCLKLNGHIICFTFRWRSLNCKWPRELFKLCVQCLQSLVTVSIDLHRNGENCFYTNLTKMPNYYNIPFNFNYDNLDDTKIIRFVDHMQKKYITHWKHSLCNSQKLEFYNVF